MSGLAAPVLGRDGAVLDRIELLGLTARGFHGVFEHERREGQDFRVDAVLHLDTRAAGRGDDLRDTVHYGELAVALADVLRGEPVDLLETLVERLAQVCLRDVRVQAVDLAVHKPGAPIPETFTDVVVAVRRHRPTVRAVLALGSNLGDRVATLRSAVAALDAADGVRVVAVSPVVETAPVGGPEQDDYLNAVVVVETALTGPDLLALCHAVEAAHERVREVRWGPRTLDVDVITLGGAVLDSTDLTLPHPRAAQRAFVLAPWAALDPEAVLPGPGGGRVADLLALAADRDGVRPRPGLELGTAGR